MDTVIWKVHIAYSLLDSCRGCTVKSRSASQRLSIKVVSIAASAMLCRAGFDTRPSQAEKSGQIVSVPSAHRQIVRQDRWAESSRGDQIFVHGSASNSVCYSSNAGRKASYTKEKYRAVDSQCLSRDGLSIQRLCSKASPRVARGPAHHPSVRVSVQGLLLNRNTECKISM